MTRSRKQQYGYNYFSREIRTVHSSAEGEISATNIASNWDMAAWYDVDSITIHVTV